MKNEVQERRTTSRSSGWRVCSPARPTWAAIGRTFCRRWTASPTRRPKPGTRMCSTTPARPPSSRTGRLQRNDRSRSSSGRRNAARPRLCRLIGELASGSVAVPVPASRAMPDARRAERDARRRIRAGARRLGCCSATEPACSAGRAELLLLEGVLARRVVSLGLGPLASKEVDLDLAHESCAELGVTDA